MYNNTGSKILIIANIVAAIGIAASVIAGILAMPENFFLGFVILIIGSFASWVSCLLMAAFGELVQNTNEMVALLRKTNSSIKTSPQITNSNIKTSPQTTSTITPSKPKPGKEHWAHIYTVTSGEDVYLGSYYRGEVITSDSKQVGRYSNSCIYQQGETKEFEMAKFDDGLIKSLNGKILGMCQGGHIYKGEHIDEASIVGRYTDLDDPNGAAAAAFLLKLIK